MEGLLFRPIGGIMVDGAMPQPGVSTFEVRRPRRISLRAPRIRPSVIWVTLIVAPYWLVQVTTDWIRHHMAWESEDLGLAFVFVATVWWVSFAIACWARRGYPVAGVVCLLIVYAMTVFVYALMGILIYDAGASIGAGVVTLENS